MLRIDKIDEIKKEMIMWNEGEGYYSVASVAKNHKAKEKEVIAAATQLGLYMKKVQEYDDVEGELMVFPASKVHI